VASTEEREVAEVRAFFEAKGRSFLIGQRGRAWEVMFPIKGYPSAAPYAVGRTRVQAAQNALALWFDRPDLGGCDPSSGV
jgi:hypothetical protein